MNTDTVKVSLSFTELEVRIERAGSDCVLTLTGGDSPHIGCAVLSAPRPSLGGSKEVSCTSSVINLMGHKDEEICRYVAEAVCRALNTTVVCAGGVHTDNITAAQILEIKETLPEFSGRIITFLKAH